MTVLRILDINRTYTSYQKGRSRVLADDERFQKSVDYVVENYLDAGCDFPPTSTLLSQTFTYLSRRYFDNFHEHFFGVTFTVTATCQVQQSRISATQCTLTTARDVCPENSTCSVHPA